MIALARRAEWHWMLTATGFIVMWVAATHITMNPVAVNIQCHSARRANAIITPGGIDYK